MNKIMRTVAALGVGAFVAFSSSGSRAFAEAPNTKARPSTTTVILSVEGMTCAACPVAVTTALKKLDGVKEAKVSLSEKNAVVYYDVAKVKPQQMVDVVNKLGYQATLPLASKH